jgi:hypothetical protein
VAAALAGCAKSVVGSAAPATVGAEPSAEADVAFGAADTNGLITAQYARCDVGAQILNYLATGDNGGDPGLDQVFASFVGVPAPQARALADQYIQNCDAQQAEQEAAASSSAAALAAEAAASASEVLDVPCRGAPFRAENGARPPADVVVAWSFEAGLKSGAGSCAVGRCVCFEHEDQIRLPLQLVAPAQPPRVHGVN